MNQDQETQVVNNETGEPADLARSVLGRANGGRQMLSPWLQRQLDRRAGPATPAKTTPGLRPQPALTVGSTLGLLNRLQRTADQSAVWQPNLGSLTPHLVDHFTSRVISRFPETGKYQVRPGQAEAANLPDFALAGVNESSSPEPEPASAPALPFTLDEVRRALEGGDSGPGPSTPPSPRPAAPPVQRATAPSQPQRSGPLPFTMTEVRAALEQPHFTRTTPAGQPHSTEVQRASEPSAPPPGRPPRVLPSGRRAFSRVEEVSAPGARTPATPQTPGPAGIPAEAGSATAEASSGQIQRQADDEGSSPESGLTSTPAGEGLGQQPAAPDLPLREKPARPHFDKQPVESSMAGKPAAPVQRQVDRPSESPQATAAPMPEVRPSAPAEVKPSTPSSQPTPKTAPPVQRSPESSRSSLPPVVQAADTPAPTSAEPVQLRRMTDAPASPEPPAASSTPGDEPVKPRQVDVELPLREIQLRPEIPAREPEPETFETTRNLKQVQPPARSEPGAAPLQRQIAPERPLQEPAKPVSQTGQPAPKTAPEPAETEPKSVRSEIPTRSQPLQRQASTATTPPEPVTPSALESEAPPPPAEHPVQRQVATEMPLRETPERPGPATMPAVEEKIASSVEATQSSSPPAMEESPALFSPKQKPANQPAESGQADLEMGRPAVPTESKPSQTVQTKKMPAATESSQPAPRLSGPAIEPKQDAPAVQRQVDSELPRREPEIEQATTPAELELKLPQPPPAPQAGSLTTDQSTPSPVEPVAGLPAAKTQQGSGRQGAAVQRQPVQTATDLPLRPPVAPTPGPSGQDEPGPDLGRQILAKATSGVQLPLIKPPAARPDLNREQPGAPMPALPQARVQRQLAEKSGIEASAGPQPTEVTTPPASPAAPLPLARPARIEIVPPGGGGSAGRPPARTAAAPGAIQRQPAPVAPAPETRSTIEAPDIIQREPEEQVFSASNKSSPQSQNADLDKLARQILPEIKRLLARERDRLGR